jgi:hypothetical protein
MPPTRRVLSTRRARGRLSGWRAKRKGCQELPRFSGAAHYLGPKCKALADRSGRRRHRGLAASRSPQTTALDPALGPGIPLDPMAPRTQAPVAGRATEAICAQPRLDTTRVSIYDDRIGASPGKALAISGKYSARGLLRVDVVIAFVDPAPNSKPKPRASRAHRTRRRHSAHHGVLIEHGARSPGHAQPAWRSTAATRSHFVLGDYMGGIRMVLCVSVGASW